MSESLHFSRRPVVALCPTSCSAGRSPDDEGSKAESQGCAKTSQRSTRRAAFAKKGPKLLFQGKIAFTVAAIAVGVFAFGPAAAAANDQCRPSFERVQITNAEELQSLSQALEAALAHRGVDPEMLANYVITDAFGLNDWAVLEVLFSQNTDAIWMFPAQRDGAGWRVFFPGSSDAMRVLTSIPASYSPLVAFGPTDWRFTTPAFLRGEREIQPGAPPPPTVSTAVNAYRLPFANGTTVLITQDSAHHGGPIDMVGQTGTTLVAAAAGTVYEVIQSHNECCCSNVCNPCENHIIIAHANDEWTIYRHIQQNSALVSAGQYVAEGTALATEGDVGWTCGINGRAPTACGAATPPPGSGNCARHLHFELRLGGISGTYDNPPFCNVGYVVQGQTYTASACSYLPAPTLFTPPNNSTGQPTQPTFTWSAVSGATSYRIMVATNPADLPTDPNATTGGPSVVINATPSPTSYTPSAGVLSAGTRYYWEVHARGNPLPGYWSSIWNLTTAGGATPTPTPSPTPTPVNDLCSGAIALSNGVMRTDNTANATSTGDPVPTCQTSFGKGVWYTFTPASSGTVTVSTCGSNFDTVLQIYTGTCASPSAYACNDDSNSCGSGSLQSYVTFSGTSGTTYRILAGGYASQSGNLQIVARVGATPTPTPQPYPPFFNGQTPLGNNWYFLRFPSSGNCFGYYSLASFPWVYHQDMHWLYFYDANNGGGTFIYDAASGHWWYTSPTFPFSYLYDFNLQALLYYLNRGDPCLYTSNPRWFYNFNTGQWITL